MVEENRHRVEHVKLKEGYHPPAWDIWDTEKNHFLVSYNSTILYVDKTISVLRTERVFEIDHKELNDDIPIHQMMNLTTSVFDWGELYLIKSPINYFTTEKRMFTIITSLIGKYERMLEGILHDIGIDTGIQCHLDKIEIEEYKDLKIQLSWRYPNWGTKYGIMIVFTMEYLIDQAEKIQYQFMSKIYDVMTRALLENTSFKVTDP